MAKLIGFQFRGADTKLSLARERFQVGPVPVIVSRFYGGRLECDRGFGVQPRVLDRCSRRSRTVRQMPSRIE